MSNSTTPSSSSSSTPSSNTPSATPPEAIGAIGRIGTLTSPAEASGGIGELKLDGGGIRPGGGGNESPLDEKLSPEACARVDDSSGYVSSPLEKFKNALLNMRKSPELVEKAIEESAGGDFTFESLLEKVHQLEIAKAIEIHTELVVKELQKEVKDIKKETEERKTARHCKICLDVDAKSEVFTLPCCHLCMCRRCYEEQQPEQQRICPVCRRTIEKTIFIDV